MIPKQLLVAVLDVHDCVAVVVDVDFGTHWTETELGSGHRTRAGPKERIIDGLAFDRDCREYPLPEVERFREWVVELLHRVCTRTVEHAAHLCTSKDRVGFATDHCILEVFAEVMSRSCV